MPASSPTVNKPEADNVDLPHAHPRWSSVKLKPRPRTRPPDAMVVKPDRHSGAGHGLEFLSLMVDDAVPPNGIGDAERPPTRADTSAVAVCPQAHSDVQCTTRAPTPGPKLKLAVVRL